MNLAVVVLAGGEGRRIGGGKPLRTFGGEPLIVRAIRMARCWSTIVAVAVRDPAQVGSVDAELIADKSEIAGPLAGLAAGLAFAERSGCELLLTIPADMPFLPEDLSSRLVEAIAGKRAAVAASGNQPHPVCALWSTAVSAELTEYLAERRRSLRGLAQQVGSVQVEWPTTALDPFFNVNFAEDLCEAERRLKLLRTCESRGAG